MNDKFSIVTPTGETLEKKVICHFKSMDDARPNIKGVPILIADKNETNNGNNVLEFYWCKNGVYQPINEDGAWSEVKSIVVDIIKNNCEVVGEE